MKPNSDRVGHLYNILISCDCMVNASSSYALYKIDELDMYHLHTFKHISYVYS